MARTTVQEVADAGLDDWRLLAAGLHARFRTGDMPTGARLVAAVVEVAEELDHHPDVDLRPGHVDLALVSHDVGRVTRRDLRLARRVSDLAAGMGLEARPEVLAQVEVGLDTADLAAVGPVWAQRSAGRREDLTSHNSGLMRWRYQRYFAGAYFLTATTPIEHHPRVPCGHAGRILAQPCDALAWMTGTRIGRPWPAPVPA